MIGGKLNKRITLLRGKVRVIVANIKEVGKAPNNILIVTRPTAISFSGTSIHS